MWQIIWWTQCFHCRGLGSILGWGKKVQQVMLLCPKKEEKSMFKETGFDRLLKDRRDVPSDIVVKNLPANAGDSRDAGSIPGSGWSLKEEMATHSSFLSVKSQDRAAWWATIHGDTESQTQLSYWGKHGTRDSWELDEQRNMSGEWGIPDRTDNWGCVRQKGKKWYVKLQNLSEEVGCIWTNSYWLC